MHKCRCLSTEIEAAKCHSKSPHTECVIFLPQTTCGSESGKKSPIFVCVIPTTNPSPTHAHAARRDVELLRCDPQVRQIRICCPEFASRHPCMEEPQLHLIQVGNLVCKRFSHEGLPICSASRSHGTEPECPARNHVWASGGCEAAKLHIQTKVACRASATSAAEVQLLM